MGAALVVAIWGRNPEYGTPTLPKDLPGLHGGRLPDGRLSTHATQAADKARGTNPAATPANP